MKKSTIFSLFLISASVVALPDPAMDESIQKSVLKNQELQNLTHRIEVAKAKAELARLEKDCRLNKGCIDDQNNQISKLLLQEKDNKNEEFKKNISATFQEELNELSITAIIDKYVVFDNLAGRYKSGDTLFDGLVEIIGIKDSEVSLKTPHGIKIIKMDWID